MNIVFLAAECAPFAKVGGLGDVIGALPATLARMGHSVRVMLPHHGSIDDASHGIQPYETFKMKWNGGVTRVEVSAADRDGVTFYFIRGWPFFARNETFLYHADEGIDVGRFLFFAAAALQLTRRLAARHHWRPDIFHAHDWHAGALPYLLHQVYPEDPVLGQAASLFSIHNMQYQGWGLGWHIVRAGLPPVEHPLLLSMGKTDNMLATGLAYSTMLSTVSPRYGQEIATPEGGFGLDGLIHARSKHLVGILNGIDYARWNPATSEHLAVKYDVTSLEQRKQDKRALQAEMGLPHRRSVPLVGTVMRLVDQKGPGIMLPAARHLLETTISQFVLLGAGQPYHEQIAKQLGLDFKRRAVVRLGFDEPLSERIYAGIDLFLMPSMFEPCGIGQMIAMRYGALPLVRPIGGLADTVDETTGFLIADYSVSALDHALAKALEVYDHDRDGWEARQRAAMQRDFSWQRSAQQYVELYQEAIDLHRIYA